MFYPSSCTVDAQWFQSSDVTVLRGLLENFYAFLLSDMTLHPSVGPAVELGTVQIEQCHTNPVCLHLKQE